MLLMTMTTPVLKTMTFTCTLSTLLTNLAQLRSFVCPSDPYHRMEHRTVTRTVGHMVFCIFRPPHCEMPICLSLMLIFTLEKLFRRTCVAGARSKYPTLPVAAGAGRGDGGSMAGAEQIESADWHLSQATSTYCGLVFLYPCPCLSVLRVDAVLQLYFPVAK